MKVISSIWRILAPVIVVLFLGGGFSGSATAGSTTVRAADDSLLEGLFQTYVVGIGLKRLGYDVGDVLHTTIPAMHIAVANGDAQFCTVSWHPLQDHYFEKAGGKSKMTRLGNLVSGAQQGYLIDAKTSKKYGITNIGQLKDPKIAKLFDADGDGKADLAGCPPGWGCERVIEHQMNAYKLRQTVTVREGEFMMMAADTISRFKAGKPVLYYTYTPMWMTQVLRPGKDVVWLSVPFTSLPDRTEEQNKNAKTHIPDGRNLGFLINDITIISNNSFLKSNPVAKRWFELVQIPIEDVNKENYLIYKGEDTSKEIYSQAEKWFKDNKDKVEPWLEEARKLEQ